MRPCESRKGETKLLNRPENFQVKKSSFFIGSTKIEVSNQLLILVQLVHSCWNVEVELSRN